MYVVRVVLRDANERYLTRGKLTEIIEAATWYHHPSAARKAVAGLYRKWPKGGFIVDILDPNDPERKIEQ
jgi:hypothetical protein